ncbi:hypothetical protein [Shewanella sediminis]|uniref:hypothetical protein n=1 Tax=Shewanella sediminis TaxID=271097 RepID=UPI000157233A|nr:hypothetical protein [Shewanella sediminis]
MNRDLVIFSKRVRAVFQNDRAKIDLPFFSGFPKNSCRGASIFLGYLLNARFPDSMIELIHGSNRYKNEHHYWLEVDGYIFDITADQFDQFSSPIYASLANPLQTYFSVIERSCVTKSYMGYALEETLKSDILRNLNVLLSSCKMPF